MHLAATYIYSMQMAEYEDIISELRDAPLLVCDIDEVVLEFLTPFMNFLDARGLELQPNSFALNGNIFDKSSNIFVHNQTVKQLIEAFYKEQAKWQTPVNSALSVLANLAPDLDIIFISAMPSQHHKTRLDLLNHFNFTYPLIAKEQSKGPIVKAIHNHRNQPLFFIDDMNYNHRSVRKYHTNAYHIALMANQAFQAIAPPYDAYVEQCDNWHSVENYIRSQL